MIEIAAGSRDVHELAEQGPGGRKRDGLDGLESDNATQLADLGAIKDLGEEATLAGPGLARDKGSRRRPLPTRAVDQLGQLIELLPAADERRAHRTSLQRPKPRTVRLWKPERLVAEVRVVEALARRRPPPAAPTSRRRQIHAS